jgi:hypothetical protein
MSSRQPRSIALMLLPVFTVLAAGSAHPAPSDEPKSPQTSPPSTAPNAAAANPTPAPGRMFVVGRVLDPEGKPVPDAAVMVHARNVTARQAPFTSRFKMTPLAGTRADGWGRFRIDAPRTSSTRQEEFGAVAMATGFGAGWVTLDPDDDQPTVDISLRPEHVIHGRLFDVQGKPVPDVSVSVRSIQSDNPRSSASLHDRYTNRRSDGVFYWSRDAHDYPAWPRSVITDAEGRFTVRGVGQKLHADLTARHPRFALQTLDINTDDNAESKTLAAALAPSQIVNVRVTYADTGQPVPHSPLRVQASQGRVAKVDESETDAAGQARINSWPADRSYGVTAYPPEGQPYLVASGRVNWPKGALEQTLNIALPRGVLVHGKVTEEGTGKPVAGARVVFATHGGPGDVASSMSVRTNPDGSFRLGAEPKAGHLFVRVPDDDYVFQAVGSRAVLEGQSGGWRIYTHSFTALDLKPGTGSQEVNLVVKRGATVTGRLLGPDGEPIRDAWVFSASILDPMNGPVAAWTGRYRGKLSNGRFEIHGLAADAKVPVYFLEPHRKLGAAINLSVKSMATGPVTVRLEPCGSARASLIDPDGKPVAKLTRDLTITMVVTPGPARFSIASDKAKSLLSADEGQLSDVDPINFATAPVPDAEGRITLPVLIPGATYRFTDYTTSVRGQTGPEIRKEFTVKPGEKLILGEIRVARKPQ